MKHFKLLKRSLGMVLSAGLLLNLVACGSQEGTTPAPSTGGDSSSSSGPVEQTLYLSSGGNETIGNITVYPWSNMTLMGGLLYRTLFLAEPDLVTVNPDLAESHTVSEDGLTYTFTIVEGSKWSDGEDITAEDVAFSIKMLLKVSVSNSIYPNAFINIQGSEGWRDGSADDLSGLTVDGNVVTMVLSQPYAAMLSTLAQFVIMPEHVLHDANPLEFNNNVDFLGNPTTSGPYKLGEMNPGNYYTLVPNEHYTGQVPKITKIVSYFNDDLVPQAQAGNVDYLNTNVPEIISELNKLDYMTMHPVDILFYRYLIVNMEGVDGNQNEAMQDVRVRQALMHAIDRDAIASGLFPDLANTINSGIQNTADIYNGMSYEYNPEKAKALLAEANYDLSRPIRILYYYTDQVSVDFMDALAFYLGEVGLTVEVYRSTNGTQDLFQTRNYDLGYKGLSAFDISEWYGEYATTNGNFTNIFGGDTRFDELTSQLASATDPDDRDNILGELQEIEQESLFKLPFYTLGNNIFINTDHVDIPDDVVFGNPWYRTDVQFENWEIIG